MSVLATAIDLASFQSHLTANDYRNIGADYALVKTTENTNYVNPYIRSLIDRSAAGGIKGYAFYHFGRFHNDAQAVAEANYFIANTKAQANAQSGSLLVLDAEINAMPTSSVNVFLDTVRQAGFHTGFYTYKYLLPNFNLESIHQHMDMFWLAAYPLANGKAAGKNPDFNYFPSANYVDMWQHTDNLLGYNVDGSVILTENAVKLFNPTEAPRPVANKPIEQEKPVIKPELPSNHWIDDLGDRWFAETGTFVTGTSINLRWGAKANSALIATLPGNSEVKYDAWSRHDGYVWLRQPRSNNQYGYLVCRDAKNNQPLGIFK